MSDPWGPELPAALLVVLQSLASLESCTITLSCLLMSKRGPGSEEEAGSRHRSRGEGPRQLVLDSAIPQ